MHRTPSAPRRRRAFTLVELMVTVALVGVLGALAVQSARKYVSSSKSAEALQMVGAITNGVLSAFEQQKTNSELLADGQLSSNTSGTAKTTGSGKGATVVHGSGIPYLCGSTTAVPDKIASVTGKKYQPTSQNGKDYQTGNVGEGWTCVMFTNSAPQSYQLEYTANGAPVNVTLPKGGSPPGLSKQNTWSVRATGDVDGDGVLSWFVVTGSVVNGNVRRSPSVGLTDPDE